MNKIETFLPLVETESLIRIASPKALKAGQELFKKGAVSNLVLDGDKLSGKVMGSGPKPHSTSIRLGKGNKLEAECSCPTFTDGWEKFCHHAVALAMELAKQYKAGGEISTTHNPWVAGVGGKQTTRQRRYQLQQQAGGT